ncbi:hypothetical protein [uncultured Sphingomonas sp.]|uniref:hypothetical protein n=1 Tax=uncultured Sphingomonas sp. TaxID=158754 RepID=UPI0025F2F385|nr:hypothetical protein [uncultured Sphingomonas sp.]
MTPRAILVLLIVNAIAVAAFLVIASHFWIEPELAGVPGANIGNAFGWFLFAAPIPPCVVVIDLLCTGAAIARADRRDRLRYAGLGVALLACWVVAIIVDSAHHGM